MIKIFNTSIFRRITALLNIRNGEVFNNDVQNQIVPVLEVNRPYIEVSRASTNNNSVGNTIFTTPADKDFYLTNITVSSCKDATALATYTRVYTTISGQTQVLVEIPHITGQVKSNDVCITYPFPIKIDRGVTIAISRDNATGNISGGFSIQGYMQDSLAN